MRVHLDVCDVAALHPPRFCRPTEAVAAGAVRTDRERVRERERERERVLDGTRNFPSTLTMISLVGFL